MKAISMTSRKRARPKQPLPSVYGWDMESIRLAQGDVSIIKEKTNKRWCANLRHLRATKPVVCKWLSEEEHYLPEIVNIVYTFTLESPHFTPPLNMVRLAQFLPNIKYRPPNFAAITIRLNPTTGLLFQRGNWVIIKATSPGEALYYSHMYRRLLEQVPFILKNRGSNKLYIGTLEGKFGFSRGKIENVVGNGILYQEGVHLTRLMEAEDEKVDWEPDAFPNAIYRDHLADGTLFCANIASTGKIVLMGLKTIEGVYEAYKIMCDVVYNFEDPHVPSNPKERYRYRIEQLYRQGRVTRADEEGNIDVENMEGLGDEYDEDEHEEHDSVLSMILGAVAIPPPGTSTAATAAAAVVASAEGTGEMDNDEQVDVGGLITRAADAGQVENVSMLVEQGGEIAQGVWRRDEKGRLPIERIAESTDPLHKQVIHVLRKYMNDNPEK